MISRRQALLALAATGFTAALPWTPSRAAAPLSRTANAGFYRMQFGEFEVTALSDGTLGLPMARIYRDAPEAELQRRLEENFLGREPHVSINAYLVNDGKRLVLIDTGTGSLFGSAAGKLVRHLDASGYRADQVDAVILTHIHADHVSGARRLVAKHGGDSEPGQPEFAGGRPHLLGRCKRVRCAHVGDDPGAAPLARRKDRPKPGLE